MPITQAQIQKTEVTLQRGFSKGFHRSVSVAAIILSVTGAINNSLKPGTQSYTILHTIMPNFHLPAWGYTILVVAASLSTALINFDRNGAFAQFMPKDSQTLTQTTETVTDATPPDTLNVNTARGNGVSAPSAATNATPPTPDADNPPVIADGLTTLQTHDSQEEDDTAPGVATDG